uniref:Prefoldin subunit 4 n=1 Tax=Eptatretus burgeri TaxID=7764 RepID=A0A8C4Q1Z1_EPTBU
MAATIGRAGDDVMVTFEDQQRINKFARNTSKLLDLNEEIEQKKKELQNIEDAVGDVLMADDNDQVPFCIGEVFFTQTTDTAQTMLEESKQGLDTEISKLDLEVIAIKQTLAELKVQLYAKFGTNINLEADEE